MLTSCPKCGENSEAKLDYKDKDIEKSKVLCLGCESVLDINVFVKRMMLQRNDVIERKQLMVPPGGIQYTCDNIQCRKPFSAEVRKKDKKVYCPHCKRLCNVAAISIALLEENKVYEGYSKQYFDGEGDYRSESRAIEEAIEGSAITDTPLKVEIRPLDGKMAVPGPVKRGRGRPVGSKGKPKVSN